MAVTLHTCRGNFRSSWVAEGGYETIAEAMFSIDVDGFFMEFDSARAGSFEPLRYLPAGKRAVLGLVTTKQGAIESADEIKRRIEAASTYVPMERPMFVAAMRVLEHPSRERGLRNRTVAQIGIGRARRARDVGRGVRMGTVR